MINFRYHLVSLIAVFLALAVGIVLGVGPLKGTVSDELAAQVSQLRDRNDELRDQASKAGTTVKERDEYLTATSDQLVGNLLPGQQFVLVSVGDVPGQTRDAVRTRLEQAGGTKVGDIRVSDTFWSEDSNAAVSAAATTLRENSTLPDQDLDDETYVEQAFAAALASTPPPDKASPQPEGQRIFETLKGAKLISGSLDGHATSIVLLYPHLGVDPPAPTPDPMDVAAGSFGYRLAGQLAAGQLPVVAVGAATWSGESVSQIRADDEMRRKLSSIDNADELTGQLSVPRALGAQFNGVVGHYGTASNATGPFVGATDSNSSLVPPYLKAAASSDSAPQDGNSDGNSDGAAHTLPPRTMSPSPGGGE